MKKILQNIGIGFLCLLALTSFCYISLSLFGSGGVLSPFVAATTVTPTSTTQARTTEPSTVPTTEPTTQITTTELITTAAPVIEFEGFSVIDYYPLSLATGGSWDIKHCQGMAIDKQNGYAYYSYTNTFVKCDLEGNAVGTLTGFEGHLGDVAYNEKDGKVYASLNPVGKKALYVAIIDVANLNKKGLDCEKSGLVRTVHLPEVWKDFSAKVKNGGKTYSRRYGVSGTDALCFGPSFSSGKGHYLTISCGTTPQTERTDNDYQVLVQYDVSSWWDEYGKPLDESKVHHSGPAKHQGKYFVYTGNTNYGVQTMTYFPELNLWLLNVYTTLKEDKFPDYNLFIVDGDIKPEKKALIGQDKEDIQKVLTLYQDGLRHENTGIYGWFASNGAKGIEYIEKGLFYIIHPYKTWYGKQTGVAYLYVWDGNAPDPFAIAAGVSDDYVISKKVVPTTEKATKIKESK